MRSNRLRGLRILVMVILAFLIIQFEFGMAVNITNPPALAPFSFSITKVSDALHQVGTVALLHAILGAWLAVLAVVSLVMSLVTRVRSVQIVGTLAFFTIILAATSGLLFVLSGYQNDNFSHGMATNFILSFTFYFLELYFLKPDPKNRPG